MESLHKTAQLLVVVGGFYTAQALLPWRAWDNWESGSRLLATALFILGLAVRYWWVILLLDWPFRVARVTLLLLVWSGVVFVASSSRESADWILGLIGVAWLGAITEGYNLSTGQWRRGNAALMASLYRDHIVGLVSALAGGIMLLGIAIYVEPRWQPFLVLGLVLFDWVRLLEMIWRHQRLLES